MPESIPRVAQAYEPRTMPECPDCAWFAAESVSAELAHDWRRLADVTDMFAAHLRVVTQ